MNPENLKYANLYEKIDSLIDEVDNLSESSDCTEGLGCKSAYEIAVEQGFVGTKEEWLFSLIGADGVDGVSPGIEYYWKLPTYDGEGHFFTEPAPTFITQQGLLFNTYFPGDDDIYPNKNYYLILSNTDANGIDYGRYIAEFDKSTNPVRGYIKITDVADVNRFLIFKIRDASIYSGVYTWISYTYVTSNGVSPDMEEGGFGTHTKVRLEFFRAGNIGLTGSSANITSATATGLSAGSNPTVTLGGTPQARTITFGIPKGDKGDTGNSGTITSVTVTELSENASPTITLGGTPSARTIALGIPKGATGEDGREIELTKDSTGLLWKYVGELTEYPLVDLEEITGPQGENTDITSVSAVSLNTGETPTATLGGTPLSRTIQFGIPKGATGDSGTITSVSATGLSAGASPTVTLGGTPSARTFQFGIPKGDKGDKGDAGTISSITVTSLAAGATPTISLGGTPQDRTITLGIPKGDKGDKGDTGASGVISSASVTKLLPLATPTVTLGGTPSDRTIALGLPQGMPSGYLYKWVTGVADPADFYNGYIRMALSETNPTNTIRIGTSDLTGANIFQFLRFISSNMINNNQAVISIRSVTRPSVIIHYNATVGFDEEDGYIYNYTVNLAGTSESAPVFTNNEIVVVQFTPKGLDGDDGINGTNATISSATATALPQGSAPTVTLGGTSSNRTFAFGIPGISGLSRTIHIDGVNGVDTRTGMTDDTNATTGRIKTLTRAAALVSGKYTNVVINFTGMYTVDVDVLFEVDILRFIFNTAGGGITFKKKTTSTNDGNYRIILDSREVLVSLIGGTLIVEGGNGLDKLSLGAFTMNRPGWNDGMLRYGLFSLITYNSTFTLGANTVFLLSGLNGSNAVGSPLQRYIRVDTGTVNNTIDPTATESLLIGNRSFLRQKHPASSTDASISEGETVVSPTNYKLWTKIGGTIRDAMGTTFA